jgi:hypothetical protein
MGRFVNVYTGSQNKNPLLLPRFHIASTDLTAAYSASSGADSTNSTFWGAVADFGATIDDTDFVIDTYRDVVDYSSGGGWLTLLIGAEGAGTISTTWRVTVDGTVTTLPSIRASATDRGCAGVVLVNDVATGFSSENSIFTTETISGSGDIDYNDQCYVLSPQYAALRGLGVRFENSLKVEVAYSGTIESTTWLENSGALYVTDE